MCLLDDCVAWCGCECDAGGESMKENPVVVVTERRVTVHEINLEGVMVAA